jgi:starch synthase
MPNRGKPRVLFVASEVVGFAKTGGLADVTGALPAALARRGLECTIILPLYRCVREGKAPLSRLEHTFTVPVGNRKVAGGLWRSTLPGSDVPVYLIEQAEYFERDDPAHGRGLYQFTLPGGQKRDYPDNCERFVFFCRGVLEALSVISGQVSDDREVTTDDSQRTSDNWPDVLHLNDWQSGLIPVYLHEEYGKQPAYDRLRTLLTIHNVSYQGQFWHWDMLLTGLDWRLFNFRQLEFYGMLNFLKAGIVFADMVSTVSPTYAKEIQTPYYGCGLEGVLTEKRDRLFGIVNGADYRVWNPATDGHLPAKYDVDSVGRSKPLCKAALQRRYGLPAEPRTPLLGMVARLVEQKGLDLVCKIADSLLQQGIQLVILGEGDAIYHRVLADLRTRFPNRFGVVFGFDETLAHQIEGGADIFLMPSHYEPAGLNQLYSLKYGTMPVVRATGGLADTITDVNPETLAAGTATGFIFTASTPMALLGAVDRALDMYRNRPDQWLTLVQTGMRQDWSWDRVAGEYEKLYQKVVSSQ